MLSWLKDARTGCSSKAVGGRGALRKPCPGDPWRDLVSLTVKALNARPWRMRFVQVLEGLEEEREGCKGSRKFNLLIKRHIGQVSCSSIDH